MRVSAFIGFCLAAAAFPALAQSSERWAGFYDAQALEKAAALYSGSVRGTWEEDLLQRLPSHQRQAIGPVRLQLPLVGADKRPFAYYALPEDRIVVVPIQSVKFLDDLATAQAWFLRRNCPTETVLDYVALLRYADAGSMPGGRLPTPPAALGVPDNALKDPWVYDVSGKVLKSVLYFLMAHEAGHVAHAHRRYDEITSEQAQAQEAQADTFALDVMQRIGLAPNALAFFFTAFSWFEAAPSDFPSMSAYDFARRRLSTHPVTSARLDAIASRMQDNAAQFVRVEPNPQKAMQIVLDAAKAIRKIGTELNDPRIREYQKYRGQRVTLKQLQTACP